MAKKKKKLTKKQKIFRARLGGFISVGFVAPITYLIARYHLFIPQKTEGGVQVAVGLWGVICFAMVVALCGVLVYYYLEGMKFKYTPLKQIVSGLTKVIGPMLVFQLLLITIRDNVGTFIETMWVFIGCEAAAIPINPLPQYAFENNIKGMSDVISKISRKSYNDIEKEKAKQEENK